MKRMTALLTALALCPLLLMSAAAGEEELWRRVEGEGAYVTVRVPCGAPEDLCACEGSHTGRALRAFLSRGGAPCVG